MKSEATQIPSDEATAEELALAREQGDAYVRALQHMVSEVADDGGEQRAGPYIVAYAIEKAEGMYVPDEDGDLVWREPMSGNVHVEVSVRDAADGRFVPDLTVHVRLTDSQGLDIGLHRQPLLWHPWLYHYGRNWAVPHSGDYTMDITIKAPDFPRHDKKNGKRYSDDVEVSFTGVKMKVD
jgi:hypothetical protein